MLFMLNGMTTAAENESMIVSTRAVEDIPLSTDPNLSFWRAAHPVYADKDPWGETQEGYRTEIRSRWTTKYLYFLFICPYQELNLKPTPTTSSETNELWNWDVAEVFLGSDFQNIRRYKEFEMSPQGEWIDLDIDLTKPPHEDGWRWNSGFTVAARIDSTAKIWYGAMRIPFSAIDHTPLDNEAFRINLFRSQGPASNRVQITWQPTFSHTFHVPERFGELRLVDTK